MPNPRTGAGLHLTDPGMDRNPDEWESPVTDPDFDTQGYTGQPQVAGGRLPTENVDNPNGELFTLDGAKMHREVMGSLGAIRDAVTNRRSDAFVFDLTTASRLQTHVRMRAELLVMSLDAAGSVTITIGTFARVFNFPAADTKTVPFPMIVERGLDVTVAVSAGNLGACYLVGSAE